MHFLKQFLSNDIDDSIKFISNPEVVKIIIKFAGKLYSAAWQAFRYFIQPLLL